VSAQELKDDRDETLRRVFHILDVAEAFRSRRHHAIYPGSRRHGLLWRTMEQSRLARQIWPYVPRSVCWAATNGLKQKVAETPSIDTGLR